MYYCLWLLVFHYDLFEGESKAPLVWYSTYSFLQSKILFCLVLHTIPDFHRKNQKTEPMVHLVVGDLLVLEQPVTQDQCLFFQRSNSLVEKYQ